MVMVSTKTTPMGPKNRWSATPVGMPNWLRTPWGWRRYSHPSATRNEGINNNAHTATG